ncbi:energy transducer TonB [Silvibacterium dinghuense]|uniref:TonB family protein n=1 Tax=Silvibacterium dinghuense TaxID=1560006 RepID=A0A4Q1SH87_9BACT|nr:TonB family protein [Silvibacterium dinghuense]RXS96928.1 TonB family protein [Silvibacterium dinghuense]GGG94762.1 hypothetical protein GCM10011586_07130 [Silvibacterium dinghuense]
MNPGANEDTPTNASKRRLSAEPSLASALSLLTHVLVLLVILYAARPVWKPQTVRTRGGHATVLYWNAGVGIGAAQQHTTSKTVVSPARQASRKNLLQAQAKPALATPSATKTGELQAASAGASQTHTQFIGNGESDADATPAWPTFSPNPPVGDRSLLPANETNIVVDVNVSADGLVLDEKLIRGLGNGLDQSVLDTVRSWRFHPATRNGAPVASISELVFPMSPRYHA